MKIVCDACQAKYSISDDKVQGKVFKIRCKKCSNIIVVRGGAGAAEPAAAPQQDKNTRVYDYGYDGGDQAPAGDDAVWHVVINQDQVGPMTALDVQRRFKIGEIDGETYIWREGFSDWLPLSQVDTFAQLATAGAAASEPAPAPRAAAASSSASDALAAFSHDEGTSRSDPGDLFATASSGGQGDDDGDLFGGKRSANAANPGAKMRGERNENSVLFSLNNLAQLASDKPAPAVRGPASPAAPAGGSATGSSGGEGSGLIDIRSMASAYLGGPGSPSKPATAGIGSIDDLPVFGGGGFTEPAVIVPISQRSGNNKLLYMLIGSVGLLAVAAVIVVLVVLKGGDKQTAATTPPVAATSGTDTGAKPASPTDQVAANTPPPSAVAPTPAPPATGNSDIKPATGDSGAPPAAKLPTDSTPPPSRVAAATPTPAHKASPASPATSSSSSSTSSSSPAKAPTKIAKADAPAPKADTPAPKADKPDRPDKSSGGDSGGCDEVSCVLNSYEGACCAKFRKGKAAGGGGGQAAPKSGGGGDLPDSLDRAMIADGVGKIKAKVMTCGDKSPAKGQVKVAVKVGADGKVTSVTVKNTPDAALGNCVANMMQKATFARTQTGGSFAYPYTF